MKNRKSMDITETEDIKKRWQEHTEKLYKKYLHDPDNHNGVITHLEPDILESKVKWALGSITTDKASTGDGIPAELFQILKDDAVKVLHSICQQIWKTQQWPQNYKRSVSFHSNPKEGQCQRIFKLPHNCTHLTGQQSNVENSPSEASTVRESRTSDVQIGFTKGKGTRDQIANGSQKKQEFQKNFCFIDYAKAIDCVDHNKLWKILKEMGMPNHLICLLRNLYAGQEATVRTRHGTTDWFQMGKGVHQGCILSPCLLNFYAEYIMRNAGLDESQPGIQIARRNINNLRYADGTILVVESEEELKSLLMKVKEESEKTGSKRNVQNAKIMDPAP